MSADRRLLVLAVAWLLVAAPLGSAVGGAPVLATGGDDEECSGSTAAESDCPHDGTTTPKRTTTPVAETPSTTKPGNGDTTTTPSEDERRATTSGNERTRTKRRTTTPGDGPPSTTRRTTTSEAVTVAGEPDLRAFLPENTVAPGERTRLVVQLSNAGDVDDGGLDTPPEGESAVTTARNVRVTLEDSDAPVTVRTATTPIADLPAGSIGQAGFQVVVDEDADPGVYELEAQVDYEYTEEISNDDRDENSESETFELKLVVTENARFEVVDVDEDLQVGETGTVAVTLENVGEADLTDATVTVGSRNRDLRVDSGLNATRFVGDWAAGEEKTVKVQATANETAGPQRYALTATVRYTDGDGVRQRSLPLPFGVRLDDEQAFDVSDVEGDLRVGEDGTVTGTVTNEGPQPVADAVVRLVDGDGDVVARRSTYVVGDLDDGESEDFEIPVRVPGDAQPGERRLSFVVEYLNRDGDPRTSGRLFDTVDVADERDSFAVVDVDEGLQVGETGTVDLTLDNLLGEDLTDATVTVNSPNADLTLGAGGNATRYVGDWEAGDEQTASFEATVANDSAPGQYPLRVTVEYTDEAGDEERSEVLVVSVSPDAEQQFAVRDVASTLRVGEEGRINATLVNTGPRTVGATVVRLVDTGPNVEARDTEVVLGALSAGEGERFSLPATVLDTAQPGPRRVTVVVAYVTPDGDRRTSDPIPVVVGVSSETDRFELAAVDADLQAGDDGTVELAVVNRGDETLSDATVSLTSRSSSLLVGDGVNDTRFVGAWSPGERRVVRYAVEAVNETGNQTYAFEATVNYEDDAGQPRSSDALAFGATPVPEQAFDARTVASTLRVGQEGRVTVALANRGPRNVSAAGVELVTDAPNVEPVETAAALGDLRAGGTATFELPIEISESAAAGTRQLTYRVQYTDDDGDRRTSDLLTTDVRIEPERPAFVVTREVVDATAGEAGVVELTVTNNRGVTVTDVQAKAFADDPLSVDDDQAFVAVLEPNESATIRFAVTPAGGATAKAYPLSVDFLYTAPDGDTQLSEPVTVGVSVQQPTGGLLPWWVLPLVAVLLLLFVAAVLLRRRRRAREDEAEREAADETAEGEPDGAGADASGESDGDTGDESGDGDTGDDGETAGDDR